MSAPDRIASGLLGSVSISCLHRAASTIVIVRCSLQGC